MKHIHINDEKNLPISIIIFGSTGDLSVKKIFPALEMLHSIESIKNIEIIAVGRKEINDKEFIEFIDLDKEMDINFKKKIKYFKGDISKPETLSGLEKVITKKNKIFFFATHPEFYPKITQFIKDKKLNLEKEGFTRAVFEKPFGESEKSAKKINKDISKIFDESQIYRIDHYLGKETVQNLLVLRFANLIFEQMWNNKHISNIQITIDEESGIDKRGQYYDKTGAIKDMLQNHIFQIISLLLLKSPKEINHENIHREKEKILKNIIVTEIITGQYESYQKEEYVVENSNTETFFTAIIKIRDSRYRGIPIYVRTGKKLPKKESKIVIEFKKNGKLYDNEEPNVLIINMSPKQDISFDFNIKIPGMKNSIKNAKMEFCHECEFKENSSKGYEKLFIDIINEDKMLFITEKELSYSWKIIDSLKMPKPIKYRDNTMPESSEKLISRYGHKWR